MNELKTQKTVVIGVTGSIAAYKIGTLISLLKKAGLGVHIAMTKNAVRFVAPLTFETLSGNAVTVDEFKEKLVYDVEHISLAKRADIFVVAPATANFIGKYACGIADDFLSTTAMAVKVPVLIAPAMNTAMLQSAAVQANIGLLNRRGVNFIYGGDGILACGDTGAGRMAEPAALFSKIMAMLHPKADYAGKSVLVTAGATVEDVDRVRFISNYSSGKMGAAIADAAAKRGAVVTLVAGAVKVLPKDPSIRLVSVKSTEDMFNAVKTEMKAADYIIKAAAPADYSVETAAPEKLKGDNITLTLKKNPDIAAYVGKNKSAKKLVIFCAETTELIENARKKLKAKNADMVVANDITKEGAGFDTDTNIVTIIDKNGERSYDIMPKAAVAEEILDRLLKL